MSLESSYCRCLTVTFPWNANLPTQGCLAFILSCICVCLCVTVGWGPFQGAQVGGRRVLSTQPNTRHCPVHFFTDILHDNPFHRQRPWRQEWVSNFPPTQGTERGARAGEPQPMLSLPSDPQAAFRRIRHLASGTHEPPRPI